MIKKTAAALALSVLLLGTARSEADYAIEGFSPASSAVMTGFTLGYSFTLSQSEYVSGLSVYDAKGSAPLAGSHDVGIWTGTGKEVAATTVGPASNIITTPGPNSQSFADASLAAPVLLAPGTYFIGAYYASGSTDTVAATTSPATFSPIVGYQFATYNSGAKLANPTTAQVGPQGFIGPNFTFSPQAVPEPSALILTGVGAVGLLVGGYFRRKPATA